MEIPENCEGCIASCVCETMNVPGCDECVEFHKLVVEKLNSTQQTKAEICSNFVCNYCSRERECLDVGHAHICFTGRKLSAVR